MNQKAIKIGGASVMTAIFFAVETELDFDAGRLQQALRTVCWSDAGCTAVEITKVRKGRFNVLASAALSVKELIAALTEIERKTKDAMERNQWLELLAQ